VFASDLAMLLSVTRSRFKIGPSRGPLWVLAGFALSLFSVVLLGSRYQLQQEHERLRRDVAVDAANLAIAFEQNVARVAGELDRILVYLRRAHERSEGRVPWSKLVTEEFFINDQAVQIAVIDAKGMMITSTAMPNPARPVDLSDREHYRFHATSKVDQLHISRPMIGRASGRWSVQFTRRLTDASGAFAGVVVISLDPVQLADAHRHITLRGGGLALVGADGIVRSGTGPFAQALGRGFQEGRLLHELPYNYPGVALAEQVYGSSRKIVASRKVAGFPMEVLVVVDGVEMTDLWSDRQRSTNLALVGFGALIVGALVAAMRSHRSHERKLVRIARQDGLTGLPNRVVFTEKLDEAMADMSAAAAVALHLIDLDGFKAVNDTYGHPSGDALLQAVAERLLARRRQGDLVARLGGDEFAIIQRHVRNRQDAHTLAQRLCDAMKEPFVIDGMSVTIGASVGVAFAPQDATNAEDLNKAADLALYEAKSSGRSQVKLFDAAMSEATRERRQLEADLDAALSNSTLDLHYQPIFCLQTSALVGYEALARWQHPTRGFIPPIKFIQIAEDSGMIERLGNFVLDRACRDAARWPGHLKVAVNCSPIQFKSGTLVDVTVAALERHGITPDRLEIEITETALMQRDEITQVQLTRLRDLGVRISMDDFGTGYSSLSYLQSYPISCIKIDRSFVSTLGTPQSSSSIIKAIVTLSQALGMHTIAEGVETQAQLDELTALGCTEAQGYHLGRPIPAARLPMLVEVATRPEPGLLAATPTVEATAQAA
jgi:diguanylate cyclase (GGDEF)-like protein